MTEFVNMLFNIIYLDYSTCRLTNKTIIVPTNVHVNKKNKNKNMIISQQFILTNNISLFNINNKEYYRIYLHNTNDFIISNEQTKILNLLRDCIYLYVPTLSLNQESICFGYENNLQNDSNKTIGYSNININISINDRIGVFNIIDKYKNNIQ